MRIDPPRTVALAAFTLAAATGMRPLNSADSSAHSAATPALEPGVLHGSLGIPFRAGETFNYAAKIRFLNAGSASLRVIGVETVRGQPVFHTVVDLDGHMLFFHVEDRAESWFDTTTLNSLRLLHTVDQRGNKQSGSYEFYPAQQMYVRNGEEKPTVSDPIDEGSFLYYLRTLPLEVGKTYTINRYYNLDHNPIVINVLRREHVKVPAGEFDAIVVNPVIRSHGVFSENGHAQVWLADDSTRAIVRLTANTSFGTLQLELKNTDTAGGH